VEEICTCGARLVPDALFCHRCGRPLRPLIAEDEPAEQEDAPPPAEPEPDRVVITNAAIEPEANVDFRNWVTVKSCLLAACLSIALVVLLPLFGAGVLFPLVFVGGGWFSSYLYCRSSAQLINVRSGAALGWIAGLFVFLILLVLFTVMFIKLASDPGSAQLLRDSSSKFGAQADSVNQLLDLPKHPDQLVLFFGAYFVVLTVLGSLGGLLHAFARRRRGGM
jgi:hypothetical protein